MELGVGDVLGLGRDGGGAEGEEVGARLAALGRRRRLRQRALPPPHLRLRNRPETNPATPWSLPQVANEEWRQLGENRAGGVRLRE